MSGKNIVVCLDGTGNQFKEHNSNVVKLYRVLRRETDVQVGYYDPGVGTLADPEYRTSIGKSFSKTLGLAFGRGLTRNVEQAYSYLMEQYEDGDRVFLFGFSRGAYTARALAGFIHHCGLLEKGCQNLIPYAMKLYKTAQFQVSARFRSTLGRRVEIDFLGLWDSVSTFGWIWDPVRLPWTRKNPSVRRVRHALAIDERRAFFEVNPWNGDNGNQDVVQVWFAGVHSDVGGGYPEPDSALAKVPLRWMIDEAVQHGLQIDDERHGRYVMGLEKGKPDDYYVGPSALGKQHESLQGAWELAEYLPQRAYRWEAGKELRTWRAPHGGRSRRIPSGALIHPSVRERMEKSDYRPRNLPEAHEVWEPAPGG